MKFATLIPLTLFSLSLYAAGGDMTDSTYMVESIEVTSIKQGLNIRQEPISATLLTSQSIEQNQVRAMKDVKAMVPNFHIPEYGSRITSSIYVRGLGARIDQPVVGLTIDNVPYLNKNSFDTDVMDISRMEVLRGPQSSLYGRNTMGGVVNIYTLSPMAFEGLKVGAEYSSGNSYRVRATLYERLSERVGIAVGGYYSSSDGLFENEYTGEMCDTEREGGGRIKVVYNASPRTTIENTTAFSILDQGGYPYRYLSNDYISYNDPCSYDRTMVSNGLTIQHRGERFTLSSITSYQYLDDEMQLDQDFSPEAIFTLTQATREHAITEDVVLRSNRDSKYNYLFGAFGFFKGEMIDAPVTFKEQGIEELILANLSSKYSWDDDSFVLYSDFNRHTYGAALYHESEFKVDRWSFKGALRLDYERCKLTYNSYTSTSYKYLYQEQLYERDINIDIKGSPVLDFLEVLPRVSATYKINSTNSLFASVSKGYKAGGFNTQMFSDILQQKLMEEFGLSALYSAEDIISYKPEQSWNYEIGGHFTNAKRTLRCDLSLFYIDIYNQQLTVFPEGMVTGRMMTNAGKSRSIGGEASLSATLGRFELNGAYGYTDARFKEYNDNESDYAGNYIPYSPQQTIYGAASYRVDVGCRLVESVRFEVNTNGVGKIYWNEENSVSQPLYALLGCSVTLSNDKYSLSAWGRNITDKSYYNFYFVSMSNEFVQQARPSTYGVTLNITL